MKKEEKKITNQNSNETNDIRYIQSKKKLRAKGLDYSSGTVSTLNIQNAMKAAQGDIIELLEAAPKK